MKHRILLVLLLTLFSLGLVFGIISSPRVSAATTSALQNLTWLNKATITGDVNGTPVTFFDSDVLSQIAAGTTGNVSTDTLTYKIVTSGYACPDSQLTVIWNLSNAAGHDGLGSAKAYFAAPPTGNGACQYPSTDVSKQPSVDLNDNANGFYITYAISSDGNTISRVDGNTSWVFTKSTDPADGPNYYSTNSGQCSSVIITNPAKNTFTMYELYYPGAGKTPASDANTPAPAVTNSSGCYEVGYYNQKSGVITEQAGYPLGTSSTQTSPDILSTSGSTGSATAGIQCSAWSLNPLNWLACPILQGVQDVMTYVGNVINTELQVPGQYFDQTTQTGKPIFQAWSAMRDISLGLLAVTAVVMVLSQALSFGPFDNYTVKKLLPRILVAAILITLSWSFVQLMVAISNGFGDSVRSLIYTPFANLKDVTFGSLTQGFAVGGVGVGLGVLGIFGLLSFGVTAALALLTGLAVIVIRQMLVILLAIFAPVAIVCYILPGTDKAWKLWWDSFSGVLLMFPIIEAFIAIGGVFSKIAVINNTTFNQIIAFFALYLPYFMLPAAIRLAGGAISTISGAAHDRSKSIHGLVSKFRGNTAAKNMGKMRTGSRFNERRFTGAKRFNRITQGLATGTSGGFGIMGDRGKAAMDLSTRMAAADAMKDPKMNQLAFDDPGVMAMALSAGSGAHAKQAMLDLRSKMQTRAADLSRAGVHDDNNEALSWLKNYGTDEKIDKAVATAGAVGFNRANATAAIDMMARNKNFALPGGAIGVEAMVGATDALAGVQRNASGKVVSGNQAMADNLMGSFEFNSRQAGRLDTGMHEYSTGKANLDKAWSKASVQQHAQGTGVSMQEFINDAAVKLRTGSAEDKRTAAVRILEMQNMLPYATADNQQRINKMVNDIGFDRTKPIDDQLATLVPATVVGAVAGGFASAADLRSQARVYDREDPATRGGGFGPPAAGPPAGAPGAGGGP